MFDHCSRYPIRRPSVGAVELSVVQSQKPGTVAGALMPPQSTFLSSTISSTSRLVDEILRHNAMVDHEGHTGTGSHTCYCNFDMRDKMRKCIGLAYSFFNVNVKNVKNIYRRRRMSRVRIREPNVTHFKIRHSTDADSRLPIHQHYTVTTRKLLV